MSEDYYKDLGVEKNATNEELRAAFRRKAKANHPDREGGNAAAMARINRAYEVLSSPQRRLTYDTLGKDQGSSHLDNSAREQVIQRFAAWFGDETSSGDLCFAVQTRLSAEIAKTQRSVRQGESAIKKLEKRYKRLKFKGKGTNLIGFALDAKLNEVRQAIANFKQQIEIFERAGELVKDFEYDAEPPEPYDHAARMQAAFAHTYTKT